MRTHLLLASLLACSMSSGCVAAAGAAVGGIGMFAIQDRTVGQGIDDTAASSQVKARLLAADANGFGQVDVIVEDGNLLLAGVTPTEQHKAGAEAIARSVRSVENVYNEIVVAPNRGIGRNANDSLISAQIRTRLLASPNVRGVNINIETFNGAVYLMGTARSDHELQRSAEIASTVPGVRRVISFMQVREMRSPNYAAAAPPPTPDYRGSQAPELSATR